MLLLSCRSESAERSARGLIPVTTKSPGRGAFVREQSAALFVGVSQFTSAQPLANLRYTVDDAVDLAYAFAMERKIALVDPKQVALALTGEPRKSESQEKLQKLRTAGAVVAPATLDSVQALLGRQAAAAGRDGLLILAFASHGFSRDGTPYVLTSTSRFEDTVSSLSAAKVSDLASTSKALRSLIFIDACRDRVPPGARGVRSPAPVAQYMEGAIGQVIFYAATPGNYAYEDEHSKNGVFTKAVIDGLLGCGPRTVQGVVTVEKLSRFVEDRVLQWIRDNRDPLLRKATQVSMDADTKTMPLSSCEKPPPPKSVAFVKSSLTVLGNDAKELWRRTFAGDITRAQVEDVDADGTNEVLAVVGNTLLAIDALENDLWSLDAKLPIQQLIIGPLFSEKRKRQLVTITDSTLFLIDHDGTRLATHTYPYRLQHVRVDRPTSRHERKIIVTAEGGRVFMLDPDGKPKMEAWSGRVSAPVTKLDILDFNNDSYRDIELTTATGRVYLDFEGKVIRTENVHFTLLSPAKQPTR
jgi:hypothetical protein